MLVICAASGKARVATEIPDIEVPAQNREKIDELRVLYLTVLGVAASLEQL